MGRFSPDISSRPGVTPTTDMTVLPGLDNHKDILV